MLSRPLRLVYVINPPVFVYLINLSKHRIWLARNNFRFRNLLPSAVDVISSVRSQACFILKVLFRNCSGRRARRYFSKQWGASGVIASVSGDNLSFNL